MSDWFRSNEDPHEVVEVRYLDIPDLPSGEIDEIVYRDLHLETLDGGSAYITVAGLMVSIRAVKRGHLSITCEPDDCERIDAPPTEAS